MIKVFLIISNKLEGDALLSRVWCSVTLKKKENQSKHEFAESRALC